MYESIVFPKKIMELIKKWNNTLLQSKYLFTKDLTFKNNKIFYVNNKNIIIGNLNNKNYFIPKYIYTYDT